jgi:hypothetical protein
VWSGGETVTILTRSATASASSLGNPVYDWAAETDVTGCVVSPRNSSELVQGQDTAILGLMVMMPGTPSITAVDRVRVNGVVYVVDGPPQVYDHPRRKRIWTEVALTLITG